MGKDSQLDINGLQPRILDSAVLDTIKTQKNGQELINYYLDITSRAKSLPDKSIEEVKTLLVNDLNKYFQDLLVKSLTLGLQNNDYFTYLSQIFTFLYACLNNVLIGIADRGGMQPNDLEKLTNELNDSGLEMVNKWILGCNRTFSLSYKLEDFGVGKRQA